MAARTPPPATVANSFVAHYYRVLSKKPAELFRFYKDESSFTFGQASETADPVQGIDGIKEKICSLGLEGAKVEIRQGSVDAQASREGGVVMLVTGQMTLASGEGPLAFAQTFFLAPQVVVAQGKTAPVPSYFVLNDTLRFLNLSRELLSPYVEAALERQKAQIANDAQAAPPAVEPPVVPPVAPAPTPVVPAAPVAPAPAVPAPAPAPAPVPAPSEALPPAGAQDPVTAPPALAPAAAAPAPVPAPAPPQPAVTAPVAPAPAPAAVAAPAAPAPASPPAPAPAPAPKMAWGKPVAEAPAPAPAASTPAAAPAAAQAPAPAAPAQKMVWGKPVAPAAATGGAWGKPAVDAAPKTGGGFANAPATPAAPAPAVASSAAAPAAASETAPPAAAETVADPVPAAEEAASSAPAPVPAAAAAAVEPQAPPAAAAAAPQDQKPKTMSWAGMVGAWAAVPGRSGAAVAAAKPAPVSGGGGWTTQAPGGAKAEAKPADLGKGSGASASIYVKNLHESVSEEELKSVFAQFGPIENVNLFSNRRFAFVDFKNPDSASRAMEQSDKISLKDNRLKIEVRHSTGRETRNTGFRSGAGRGPGQSGRGGNRGARDRRDGQGRDRKGDRDRRDRDRPRRDRDART